MLRRTEGVPMDSAVLAGPFEGEARVVGTIPSWLRGQLIRTAPALFERQTWRAHHWFDALGMLFAFELDEGGHVAWQQRLLDSAVARAAATGRVPYAQFATPNGRSRAQQLVQPVPIATDNANVNIVPLGERWLAMTETDRQLLVDPDTLRVTGPAIYDDAMGGMSMTPHPQLDRAHGLVVNAGTAVGARSSVVVYAHAPGSWQRREIGRWSLSRLPYLHSFGLTDDAAVVIGHPFDVKPITFLWSNRFLDHFRWRPAAGTRLAVIDRENGAVKEHETESLFVFHTVNTFRDGRDLVVDVLAYDDAKVMVDQMRVEALHLRIPDLRARLTRIRMTPGRRTARIERLGDTGFEFPSIDQRAVAGRRYQLVWGAAVSPEHGTADAIRTDLERGTVRRFGRAGVVFGEPVFVGAPNASAEGDGVVLTVGSSRREARTILAVLDATTLDVLAEASVDVPTPLGFHGSFQPRSAR
jgi:beta,beta-carotene 9',10'-dioxygenase